MRVNTNVASINAQRSLGMSNTAVTRSLGRLSSGFRINRAADDAAGLGIANQLRADLRALKQASRNAEQSNALLQIAEGGTQQVQGILERMKELATQAVSDNVSEATGNPRIDTEFQELIEELDRIVDSTKYQGTALLDGSFTGDFVVGSSGVLADDTITLAGVDLTSTTLGVGALALDTKANSATALTAIDAAIGDVSDAFASIGASQNRIDFASANVNTMIENIAAAESVIRDADMAAEMADLTRNQILQQAGVSVLAQANQSPQLVLRLLQ